MAVKIRLKRMGKIRAPYYRVVVVDARTKRDGRVIEEIGKYHPKEEPSFIEVVSDRAQYWLGVGAQPSEAVAALLKITGDWQKFKGLPGTEGTLKVKEPKRDKAEIFNEALKEAGSEPQSEAVTTKRAATKKAATKKAAAKKAVADRPATSDKPEAAEKTENLEKLDEPAATPGVETPEGATEEAEVAEAKAVDAEKRADDKPAEA